MKKKSLVLLLAFSIFPGSAAFAHEAEPGDDKNETEELIDTISIHETKLDVVPKAQSMKEAPPADAPNTLNLPIFETSHRDKGQSYLDPFLGRVIYPELAMRLSTSFAREVNSGQLTQRGPTALISRFDLNMWAVDLRFAMSNSGPERREPLDMVLKLPFSSGDHWFAPIVVFHFPLDVGPSETVYEAGFGYHGRFGALGIKLEATMFNGTPERTPSLVSRGMLGWDAVISFLASEHVGIVLEAEGSTVFSDIEDAAGQPVLGDTVVHLAPGLRFFPKHSGLEIGVAGLITLTSDSYAVLERHGAILSAGYTFF